MFYRIRTVKKTQGTVLRVQYFEHGEPSPVIHRMVLWTEKYLQVTLMTIPVGGEIGLEMHTDLEQSLRIENGLTLVEMVVCKTEMCYLRKADSHSVILVPAGIRHNMINISSTPFKTLFDLCSAATSVWHGATTKKGRRMVKQLYID